MDANKGKILVILLIEILLNGCFHEEDGSKSELEGTWKIGCSQNDDNNYNKNSSSYDGNKVSFSSFNYEDADCLLSISEFGLTGNFKLGNKMILSSGIEVTEIDYTNLKWYLTLIKGQYVTSYNSNKICGKANWGKNIKTDITNCNEFKLPTSMYDVYKIDGNNLFEGNSGFIDSRSKDSRPSQLDTDFFTKT